MNSDPEKRHAECSVFVKITATGLKKRDADVPTVLQEFLVEHGVHNFLEQKPGEKALVEAQSEDGNSFLVVFRRPKAKGGVFRRISINTEIIRLLNLKEGSAIKFVVNQGRLILSARQLEEEKIDESLSSNLADLKGGYEPGPYSPKINTKVGAMTDKYNYPAELLTWAGHRRGGVKKPFNKETGRPAQVRVETPLVKRLKTWVHDLVDGKNVPRVILLVGGPGNGKTDTVEGVIEDFDEKLNLSGCLFRAFGQQFFGGTNAKYPPRSVEVDLGSIIPSCPTHLNCKLTLVQDASEKDGIRHPGKSKQQILLSDLERFTGGNNKEIYICCVNRGILAEAYTETQISDPSGPLIDLIEDITGAVTNSPNARSCWPLENHSSVVAWPMDVDSLVEQIGESKTPFQEILDQALDSSRWPDNCPAGELCPFCTNRRMLSKEGATKRLSEMLRAFELGTAKRWSFRDLYSLVPYMLVGTEDDLVIDGKSYDPCEWAAKQVELMESTSSKDEVKASRAPYLLASGLYWHRLFPLWPRLSTKLFTEAEKAIVVGLGNDGLRYIKDFFRFTRWAGRNKSSSSIEKIITTSFCALLDPADAAAETVISKATTSDLRVNEIDEFFSLSIHHGRNKVSRRITPIENEILKRLASADEALGTDAVTPKDQKKAEFLQRTLRLFAARFTKRSLGVQSGAFANLEAIAGFKEAFLTSLGLKKTITQLKNLLNDSGSNLFVTPLMATFAQPQPPEERNAKFMTAGIRVIPWKTEKIVRPEPQQIYLKVDGNPVPVTFDLFRALDRLSKGMLQGSLSDETLAMVGRIRAQVAGVVVRDEERWFDDATIVVKTARAEIQHTGKDFVVGKL